MNIYECEWAGEEVIGWNEGREGKEGELKVKIVWQGDYLILSYLLFFFAFCIWEE